MKYRIDKVRSGLTIRVEDLGEDQDKVLEAFQQCREGRCACPTEEYRKLDSLEIEPGEGSITLHLSPSPGLELDQSEIENCLEYTRNRLDADE